AHGLGKKVLLITDEIDSVPFDLRHLRFLTWPGSVSSMPAPLGTRRWGSLRFRRRQHDQHDPACKVTDVERFQKELVDYASDLLPSTSSVATRRGSSPP